MGLVSVDIIKVSTHITITLSVRGKKYPIEIKNHEIRKALKENTPKEFCVMLVKVWRKQLLTQARVDILSKDYIHDTTAMINKLIEFFTNFK